MSLTRDDICTLDQASQDYGFDPQLIPLLQDALQGQELKHLGLQPDGWFYRRQAIREAAARLQVAA